MVANVIYTLALAEKLSTLRVWVSLSKHIRGLTVCILVLLVPLFERECNTDAGSMQLRRRIPDLRDTECDRAGRDSLYVKMWARVCRRLTDSVTTTFTVVWGARTYAVCNKNKIVLLLFGCLGLFIVVLSTVGATIIIMLAPTNTYADSYILYCMQWEQRKSAVRWHFVSCYH